MFIVNSVLSKAILRRVFVLIIYKVESCMEAYSMLMVIKVLKCYVKGKSLREICSTNFFGMDSTIRNVMYLTDRF